MLHAAHYNLYICCSGVGLCRLEEGEFNRAHWWHCHWLCIVCHVISSLYWWGWGLLSNALPEHRKKLILIIKSYVLYVCAKYFHQWNSSRCNFVQSAVSLQWKHRQAYYSLSAITNNVVYTRTHTYIHARTHTNSIYKTFCFYFKSILICICTQWWRNFYVVVED